MEVIERREKADREDRALYSREKFESARKILFAPRSCFARVRQCIVFVYVHAFRACLVNVREKPMYHHANNTREEAKSIRERRQKARKSGYEREREREKR